MRLGLLACITLVLASCGVGNNAPLIASDVVVSEPVPGSSVQAAYLALKNNSDAAITIDRVTSPQFASVAMHESLLENGVAKMRALPQLTIAAGATERFEKGGKHLMLMQPIDEAGALTLQFYSVQTLVLDIVIERPPLTKAGH